MSLLLWNGRVLGSLVYATSWNRRKEVLARIQRCLGVDRSEARRILRKTYSQLGMTVMELLRTPHLREAEIRERMEFQGLEHLPEEGGWIGVCAHTSNWEMMGIVFPRLVGKPLAVVVKALKPHSFNNWMTQTREQWGVQVLDRRSSARESIKLLRKGSGLAFVLDQNTQRDRGVFVDFFGTPACTSDGLAQLASLTGVPIIPMLGRRQKDQTLIAEFQKPIEGPRDRSAEEIHRVTQDCTASIEAFIRNYPDQWIWMHRRWRTRPEGEPPATSPML